MGLGLEFRMELGLKKSWGWEELGLGLEVELGRVGFGFGIRFVNMFGLVLVSEFG